MGTKVNEITAGGPSMNVNETQFESMPNCFELVDHKVTQIDSFLLEFMNLECDWWAAATPEQRHLLFVARHY